MCFKSDNNIIPLLFATSMSEAIIKIQAKKESRSEPKDDPPIADVSKEQILGTETNHDDDLPPRSSTVADIDIDSNNDNDHKQSASPF
ncbi:MAG: hypothetical protein WAM14_13605 [Candidatus Nitrosopolaris sp.]